MEAFDFLEITYALDSARARRFPVAVRIETEGFSTLGDSWVFNKRRAFRAYLERG